MQHAVLPWLPWGCCCGLYIAGRCGLGGATLSDGGATRASNKVSIKSETFYSNNHFTRNLQTKYTFQTVTISKPYVLKLENILKLDNCKS